MNFHIPDSMKGRELTAKDLKRLYSESVGYDRDNVPDRMDAIRYEIEKYKILLMQIDDNKVRETVWREIVNQYESMIEVQRLHRGDLDAALTRLESKSGVLASTMKAHIDRTEKKQTELNKQIAERMLDASTHLSERGKQWLQIRTAPKRTNSKGDPVYPGQRDIAAAMGISPTTVNALEQKHESKKAIRDLFAQMGVPLRKPRGATVTKRKK